jgi:hypothetical protein
MVAPTAPCSPLCRRVPVARRSLIIPAVPAPLDFLPPCLPRRMHDEPSRLRRKAGATRTQWPSDGPTDRHLAPTRLDVHFDRVEPAAKTSEFFAPVGGTAGGGRRCRPRGYEWRSRRQRRGVAGGSVLLLPTAPRGGLLHGMPARAATECASKYLTMPAPNTACDRGAICTYNNGNTSCVCNNLLWVCLGAPGCPALNRFRL